MKIILKRKPVVGILVIVLACTAWLFFQNRAATAAYEVLRPQTYTETLLLSGKVQLDNAISLKTEVQGTVESVSVFAGDAVNKGDTVLRLEDPALLLALQQAEADYSSAIADLDKVEKTGTEVQKAAIGILEMERDTLMRDLQRIQPLHDQGAVSDSELKDAEDALSLKNAEIEKEKARLGQSLQDRDANLSIARAATDASKLRVQAARLQVSRLRATAPFAGVVIQSDRKRGEYLEAGSIVAVLARSTGKRCDIAPDEKYLSVLKLSQPVSLYADGNPAERIQGEISWISQEVDVETGTVPMRIALHTDKPWLIQNMTLRCEIQTASIPDSLTVPRDFILVNGPTAVYVFKEGKAVRVPIETAASNSQRIRVLSGLKSGDTVLSPSGLKPNQRVKLLPSSGDGS